MLSLDSRRQLTTTDFLSSLPLEEPPKTSAIFWRLFTLWSGPILLLDGRVSLLSVITFSISMACQKRNRSIFWTGLFNWSLKTMICKSATVGKMWMIWQSGTTEACITLLHRITSTKDWASGLVQDLWAWVRSLTLILRVRAAEKLLHSENNEACDSDSGRA